VTIYLIWNLIGLHASPNNINPSPQRHLQRHLHRRRSPSLQANTRLHLNPFAMSLTPSPAAPSPTSDQNLPTTPEKPRLTEQEKKNNHIASEQKRRAAIREGFDRLTELVPGLEGQGRSESVVLKKSVDYMREVLQERRELVREVEARGGMVEARLKV